jgi:hypothetical protein
MLWAPPPRNLQPTEPDIFFPRAETKPGRFGARKRCNFISQNVLIKWFPMSNPQQNR